MLQLHWRADVEFHCLVFLLDLYITMTGATSVEKLFYIFDLVPLSSMLHICDSFEDKLSLLISSLPK